MAGETTLTDVIAAPADATAKPADVVVKPEDTAKPAEGQDKPAEAEKKDGPEGAPESYEDFNVPEGIELDTDLIGNFSEIAKKHNLSQKAAQEFVDLYNGALTAAEGGMTQRWAEIREGWVGEVKADTEFGGAKFTDSMSKVGAVLNKYDPDGGLRKALNETGFGDNPAFFKFFVKVGRDMTEDKLHAGSAASTPKSVEDRLNRMYPSMSQNQG